MTNKLHNARGATRSALHDLTVVATDPALVGAGLHAVDDLTRVETPFLLVAGDGPFELDHTVLGRLLAVLRGNAQVVAAIGGLEDLDRTSRWPLASHLDALTSASGLADVDVHTRSLTTGPPCTAVLRADTVVGPADELVVHRTLAASTGYAYLHAEVVARVPLATMRRAGEAVDWLALARSRRPTTASSHLVEATPLTMRPWWGPTEQAAVLAGVRGGPVDATATTDPSIALVLARAALAGDDRTLARHWIDHAIEDGRRDVEAAALAAEVLVQDGDQARAEQVLGSLQKRAPFDLALHARTVELLSLRGRPPVGRGPARLLQGPSVVDGTGVVGRTSVIVVTYNSADTIRACLEPLVDNDDIEVVVVDNSPDDASVAAISDLPVQVLRTGENLGFAAGCNRGMLASTGDAILLLNPDAVITADAVRRLRARLVTSGLDAVGPLSDHVAGAQKVDAHLPSDVVATRPGESPSHRAARIDAAASSRHGDDVREAKLLIGFCMMIARGTLARLGGLDPELFFGNDDLDLSWRITETGGRLGIAKGVFAHHVGHVSALSVGSERRAAMVRASTAVLSRKLDAYYGDDRPSGMALWDVPWFAAQA